MTINLNLSRRDFLKLAGAGAVTILGAGLPTRLVQAATEGEVLTKITPTAERVILLWMAGGMAHTETFDPKEKSEYKKGMQMSKLASTFGSIPTNVDGVRFSEGLENLAQVMDRMTLIRSFQPPDLGHILHARHQYHWHTGYTPPQTIAAPHIGSWVSKLLGPINQDLPAFIHIGQRLDIHGSPEVEAFLTPSFLGLEHGAMNIPYPIEGKRLVSPPPGISESRFENREVLYRKLLAESQLSEMMSDYQKDSMVRSMEASYRLLKSPAAKAFDLENEPKEIYDKYNTGRFGLGCLLARRVIENGARFVEVTSEHVPFGNWDTHNDGHERTIEMKKWIDAPVAQLILDLETRGLLDSTLIILASEFSRAAVKDVDSIERMDPNFRVWHPKQYGLHKHFTGAGSVLMVGGGMKKGFVYGSSADEVPCQTVENPAILEDIHATIYHALGVPANYSYNIESRPFYVTNNGEGKVIKALQA